MRILFVGVLDVNWSTNVEMKNALLSAGFDVQDFNYRTLAEDATPWWQRNPIFYFWANKISSILRRFEWLPAPIRSIHFRILGRRAMNAKLMREVRHGQYGLVLLMKADIVDYSLIPDINCYSPTWYFFMDPIEQALRINVYAYTRNATFASATFSDVVERGEREQSKVKWIAQGIDPEIFYPCAEVDKVWDLFFAGTRTKKRAKFIDKLRNRGLSVRCHGIGWENGSVYREDLVECYRKSRIVLNFCREGDGFSVRVFQVMGTGAFLLSEYCPDLSHFFKKGCHLDWVNDEGELLDAVNYYLKNEKVREGIAKTGCNLVHKHHTWDSVMSNIMGHVIDA